MFLRHKVVNYTALIQSLVNSTTSVISSPMKAEKIDFKGQGASMDNIVGKGESNFWSSSGIAGGMFGSPNNSALAMKLSIQADYDYCKHMYDQFERFINYHLENRIDGKFDFQIKFLRRCSFFEEEDRKSSLSFCQNGGHVGRLYASYGYQPYEMNSALIDNHLSGLNKYMIPLATSYTQSGKDGSGAPEKSDSELQESGAVTRDNGSNFEK